MRKIVILLFFNFLSLCIIAQKVKNLPWHDSKRLHFGISLGINTMDFGIKPSKTLLESGQIYCIENYQSKGFHVGAISDIKLFKYFHLRPQALLTFGQRDLRYSLLDQTKSSEMQFEEHNMQIESTFIELPIHIKYKGERINNYCPFLIAGINPKFDLSTQKAIKEDEMPKIKLTNKDFYYEMGAGIDFYLPYFKLATEFKYAIGTQDVIVEDDTEFTTSIDKMYSRMFVVSVNFEY